MLNYHMCCLITFTSNIFLLYFNAPVPGYLDRPKNQKNKQALG